MYLSFLGSDGNFVSSLFSCPSGKFYSRFDGQLFPFICNLIEPDRRKVSISTAHVEFDDLSGPVLDSILAFIQRGKSIIFHGPEINLIEIEISN